MRRLTLICAAATCLAAVAFPAAGSAVPGERGNSVIAKACAAEKKADIDAFRAKYGRHAMRHCIKGEVATVEPVTPTLPAANPTLTCEEERALDEEAFIAHWGTNGNGKNAWGKCVSASAHDLHGGGPPA